LEQKKRRLPIPQGTVCREKKELGKRGSKRGDKGTVGEQSRWWRTAGQALGGTVPDAASDLEKGKGLGGSKGKRGQAPHTPDEEKKKKEKKSMQELFSNGSQRGKRTPNGKGKVRTPPKPTRWNASVQKPPVATEKKGSGKKKEN